jgi:DNA-binding MurR/RpiR family transcriptional regulator
MTFTSESLRFTSRRMGFRLASLAGAYERNEAIAIAFLSEHHTMTSIADYFGVHYTTVSRFAKGYEGVV